MRNAPTVSVASNGERRGWRTTESLLTIGAAEALPWSSVWPSASTTSTWRTSELRATPSTTSRISVVSWA